MHHVLVVDDDPDTVRLLGHMVSLAGYRVTLARSPSQALEIARTDAPDAVLIDVIMYEMDGWELFDRLRTITQAPVTFLTAYRTGENAQRARELGATYMTKPLSHGEFVRHLKETLGG